MLRYVWPAETWWGNPSFLMTQELVLKIDTFQLSSETFHTCEFYWSLYWALSGISQCFGSLVLLLFSMRKYDLKKNQRHYYILFHFISILTFVSMSTSFPSLFFFIQNRKSNKKISTHWEKMASCGQRYAPQARWVSFCVLWVFFECALSDLWVSV